MMSADATNKKQTILTVLSVDDSLISQQMIKRALDSEYRVLLADNAVDALSVIYQEPIEALLLDISMPGIDGFELCRTVRSLPKFKTVPIIMVTSRDTEQDRVEARRVGATAYLTKPVIFALQKHNTSNSFF
jgi:twitching motility two-component system response regulator PilG